MGKAIIARFHCVNNNSGIPAIAQSALHLLVDSRETRDAAIRLQGR